MADTDTQTTDTDTDTDTENQTETSQDTTDWKAMARKHEKEAKRLRKEADDLRAANQTAEEKAIEDAKAAGRSEAEATLGDEVTGLRVEVAVLRSDAAKRLADPGDVLAFVKAKDVLDAEGNVDPKALDTAVDDLIQKKPHLAATKTPKVPGGTRTPAGAEPSMSDIIRAGMKRG